MEHRKIRFTKKIHDSFLKKKPSQKAVFFKNPPRRNSKFLEEHFEKKTELFYYDKYGNKKADDKRKGEMFDKIEQNVVESDLMYLKEHQEQMGLVSLLHLNHLKQSRKRSGQLDYFQLLEKDDDYKIRIVDLRRKEEQRKFTTNRQDFLVYSMELKRDQAISMTKKFKNVLIVIF